VRVLFLTQTFPRSENDIAGPFIREIALGLERLGHRVTVLAPHAEGLPGEWTERGLVVRTFRYAPARWELLGYGRSLRADEGMRAEAAAVAPLYALGARRAVRRELARESYDLLHAHWIVPNAVVLGRLPVPLAIGLHGSDVFLAERRGLRWAVRRALDRAALLTGCSPELVERICRLGFPAGRSRVIPYGVDPEKFRPDPARRSIWRERLGVPEAAPLLGTVGRMATKKGFQVLVEALPELLRRHPDLHVVFAGDGDRLGEFRAGLAGWPDRVHFPGLVLQDTLPDLYRSLDLFVLPAIHDDKGNVDGLPNVILEAMASGLPVVASRISGIPLAVEDGVTGGLIPEQDPRALLETLSRFLGSPPTLAARGRAARAKVEGELTWDAVAGQYERAYREALANPR